MGNFTEPNYLELICPYRMQSLLKYRNFLESAKNE